MSRATARRDSRRNPADRVGTRRPVLVFVGLLIAIVLTSYGIRIATDAPFLLSGTEPGQRTSRAGPSHIRGWRTCT
jgi:hypothetical protein